MTNGKSFLDCSSQSDQFTPPLFLELKNYWKEPSMVVSSSFSLLRSGFALRYLGP